MPEKASVFQTVQIGVETTPGTAVAANLKLLAVSLTPQPRTEADDFRAMGNKYASFVTLNKEWSEVAIAGKLTYNEIVYLLASLLNSPTPTQQGATTAYLWTFLSDTDGPDTGESLTIEQGDAESAWRVAGAKVASLELTFNRGEVSIGGSLIGEQMETGITMTAAPTSLTPLPVLPAHVTFKMADTQAGLTGATAMTRGFAMTFKINDKFTLAWPVGADPFGVEAAPKMEATLKIASDDIGMGLITTMRAGSTKWFRIKATGVLIASTYYNDVQIDFPAQIRENGGFSDEDGVYLVEYTLTPVHDSTWGKSFQIDVINTLATAL